MELINNHRIIETDDFNNDYDESWSDIQIYNITDNSFSIAHEAARCAMDTRNENIFLFGDSLNLADF